MAVGAPSSVSEMGLSQSQRRLDSHTAVSGAALADSASSVAAMGLSRMQQDEASNECRSTVTVDNVSVERLSDVSIASRDGAQRDREWHQPHQPGVRTHATQPVQHADAAAVDEKVERGVAAADDGHRCVAPTSTPFLTCPLSLSTA